MHVVFGAGQVGPHLARQLLAEGEPVRIVRRSPGGTPAGAEVERGDAADSAFAAHACRGASAVYHCMNPAYDARVWARLLPVLARNLADGAARSGARLVVLDNLYLYGRPDGPLSEDSPERPISPKGEIRAQVAAELLQRHRRGDVRVVFGRASDFYGPLGRQTHLGDPFWPRALPGKTVRVLLDPDAVHTYHYLPDVAAGLRALAGGADEDFGRAWMLPCLPAGTARQLADRLGRALGRPIVLRRVPRIGVRALSALVPVIRELSEMLYQWDVPFAVDDRRFRARFGVEPTPADEAARATADWAREAYARP